MATIKQLEKELQKELKATFGIEIDLRLSDSIWGDSPSKRKVYQLYDSDYNEIGYISSAKVEQFRNKIDERKLKKEITSNE